jgi:ferric-dicitrate binding protein FerR (iron transport regulator)
MTSIDAGSSPEEIPPCVVRWLAGEATPEERAEAERWLEAEPERRVRFALLERLWRTARALP